MKTKLLIIISTLVLLLAIGITWALAQTKVVTYYACVNNASGTIHMVAEGETCTNNEELVVWNNVGPPGPQGEPGEDGAQGPPGLLRIYTRTMTISVPPGIFNGDLLRCESSEDPITGGGYETGNTFINIAHNHPIVSDGYPYMWHVSGVNNSNLTSDLTIHVICADMTP